jgi:predicted flap endonuclease-1-like 5' DNA nuclease
MAKSQFLPDPAKFGADAEKALSLPVGLASPLWIAFAGAAAAGATFWWMSRWMRPTNLEAMGFKPSKLMEEAGDVTVALLEEAQEAAEAVAETVSEAVIEAAPEVVVEPVVEAVAAIAPEPVTETEPVVEAASPEPEPVAAVIEPIIDDLTLIAGIGPKLSIVLADRGLTSFAQLAALTVDEWTDLDRTLSLKGAAIRRDWAGQAAAFAKGV